jgi:hypothetical protein
MITKELIESTWKLMNEYQREHFGGKNGIDYSQVCAALAEMERFRHLGSMTIVMAMLTFKPETLKGENGARDFFDKLGPMHETLAEMFYLGLLVGRRLNEVTELERNFTESGH